MSQRDAGRSAFYAAELLVFNLFEYVGSTRAIQLAGTTLTLPVEAKFGSVDSVRSYVDAALALPSVRETFTRATVPVAVRPRGGTRSAHYAQRSVGDLIDAEIAIPDGPDGAWALRELVVLHEVAHHLDDSTGPAHGRAFSETLITLVGLVLGPEAGFAYRVILSDAGVLK